MEESLYSKHANLTFESLINRTPRTIVFVPVKWESWQKYRKFRFNLCLFVCFETKCFCLSQGCSGTLCRPACLRLRDPLASASPKAGIKSECHHRPPLLFFLIWAILIPFSIVKIVQCLIRTKGARVWGGAVSSLCCTGLRTRVRSPGPACQSRCDGLSL